MSPKLNDIAALGGWEHSNLFTCCVSPYVLLADIEFELALKHE